VGVIHPKGGPVAKLTAAPLLRAVFSVALAIGIAACGGEAAAIAQASQATPTRVPLRGTYTFVLQVDRACGWPATKFLWPVTVRVTSHAGETALGSIVFPTASPRLSNTWSVSAGPARTRLVPGQNGPGPAGGVYDVLVEGGRWEAGGPTRGRAGKGQITNGTARGARLTLTVRGTTKRWECRSDAQWSLLPRWVDSD
jgi:hypothetical protein